MKTIKQIQEDRVLLLTEAIKDEINAHIYEIGELPKISKLNFSKILSKAIEQNAKELLMKVEDLINERVDNFGCGYNNCSEDTDIEVEKLKQKIRDILE